MLCPNCGKHHLVVANKQQAQCTNCEERYPLIQFEKAEKEMGKAQKEYDKGKYKKAADHYNKAQKHADKAMEKV